MSRIAHSVGSVVPTREEEQALFDRLPGLARSWCASLALSKLGRWFSWNGCAKEQLGEYWISKMLLEFHQEGMQDPDEHPVAFDDLLGASRAKTPQAELAALKAANGGLRLAYRLMRVRRPKDNLALTLAATQGAWHADRQLSETIRDARALAATQGRDAPGSDVAWRSQLV